MIYEEEKSLINVVLRFVYEWKNAVVETPGLGLHLLAFILAQSPPYPLQENSARIPSMIYLKL